MDASWTPANRPSPLLRGWAIVAVALALVLALRGAWAAALAVLLLSPAPVLAFDPGTAGSRRASLAWLAAVVVALAAGVALLLVIVALGGLPQVHEWRALLRR